MKKLSRVSCLENQICIVICILLFSLAGESQAQRLNRRRTTTTSTTTPATPLAERENNLLQREQNFNAREAKFREREVNLTLREDGLRLREQKIAVREENLKLRELKIEGEMATSTPAPDLDLVRFHNKTATWEEIGTNEPCPENMRFFAIPGNSREGTCDCDYHQCSRPLLYSLKYDQCFWAWSQGPCEQGEFYAYNDTLHPVCLKNKCPPSLALRTSKYYFEDPDDHECYETTTRGYCEEKESKLLTTYDDPIPKCRAKSVCHPLSNPPHQECIAGNKRHLDGQCE